MELHFLDYYFDKPKYDEEYSKHKNLTYEAALRANLRFDNKDSGDSKMQEVYLGDFPVMTPRGTFIINGVERVVVSQIARSAGVYFTASVWKGRKLFGAKVIPNRGAWLEFETDSDGFIGVKIDRKRKAPVTALLRVFGLKTNEEILKTFADIDRGSVKHIAATLKKDAAADEAASFVEIYKRIRPGDLATAENARSLVSAMFSRFDRYDLSIVGRFKLNQRLNIPKEDSRLLVLSDIIKIIGEIIRLNNDQNAEPDDIDHLGNRRIRSVGELFQSRLRVGFARLRRIIQDRMSTYEPEALTPIQLVNARPLLAVTREFFASSQLSQFMDQINPLSELEHKRRISAMGPGGLTRERAGFEVRDVHHSYYGRVCPIQTPEGANIGLVNHLANFVKINELGFIETPYAKVKNGRITDEIVWLNAIDEEKYKIAHAGTKIDSKGSIVGEIAEARIKGIPGICQREEIDFIDVASNQSISVATSLIPFLEHDDANRALMGSNMQRQAVGSIKPTAPFVGTGIEEKAALDSGHLIVAGENGEISEADASHIVLKTASGKKTFALNKFKRSNQATCISQKPLVKGAKIRKGDVLADGPSTENGVLALGQNLLVSFLSWEGANFEDAIILSDASSGRFIYLRPH